MEIRLNKFERKTVFVVESRKVENCFKRTTNGKFARTILRNIFSIEIWINNSSRKYCCTCRNRWKNGGKKWKTVFNRLKMGKENSEYFQRNPLQRFISGTLTQKLRYIFCQTQQTIGLSISGYVVLPLIQTLINIRHEGSKTKRKTDFLRRGNQ